MRVACCQFNIAWENKRANFERVAALLAAETPQPGMLVLLPEVFATGFSMNLAAIAEPADGSTAQFLSETAKKFNIHLMGGLFTRDDDGKFRNEALVFDPKGRRSARYCKTHPFSLAGELAGCARGDTPVMVKCAEFDVGLSVCYDLRFPELFRRYVPDATLITSIANWPIARIEHWVTLLRARAIENQCYVAGANRCGTDPMLTYTGRSIIVNPKGEIIADAGDGERIICAELSLNVLRDYRNQLPFIRDIHPDIGKARTGVTP